LGVIHAMEGTISRFSEGTNNPFALQQTFDQRSRPDLGERWPARLVAKIA
jgi:hypothetical protein